MLGTLVLLVVVVVVAIGGIGIYNRLVALKHRVATSWSNIDVLLKQRHDELPKLVDTCRQYMQYEQETLEKVMQARNAVYAARESGDVAGVSVAEGGLRAQLGKLFAVAEAYPDLKANASFQQLQGRISELETGISDRRELYNEAVNVNNASIEQFPASIIAGMFAFKPAKLLEFADADKADVSVRALFSG
ncbi:MAG TPA: LemA family protein [Steroidobacteraceae bacterium]|jgi:LemA protein|nr:LemA family protein [Steroidobacteraceae bacterium]HNS28131.1 LemA family protein [Steroidobacteraceae bacterium]